MHHELRWDTLSTNPGAHFREWCQASIGHIRDSWNWQLVKGPGGNTATIEGLVRVPAEHACTLLKLSGHYARAERWFVNSVSRQQTLEGVPPLAGDWLEWQGTESWSQYATRARRALADTGFGLAWGMSQLGVRRAATAADADRPRTVFRTWRISGIPHDWAFEDVETFLSDASFEEVTLQERRPWRNGCTCWVFRARAAVDYDFFSTVIDDQPVEAVRLGKDRTAVKATPLPAERAQVFKHRDQRGGRGRWASTASTSDRGTQPPAEAAESGEMQVESTEVPRLDDGKSAAKNKSAEPSKRQKAAPSAPCIPGGIVLQDNAGAGNCLYLAISDALVGVGRSRRSAADLRNVVGTHIRKHAIDYEGFWAGDTPDVSGATMRDKGFAEYIRLSSRDGAWAGSIELSAFATTTDTPVYVFQADGSITVFGPRSKGCRLHSGLTPSTTRPLLGRSPKSSGAAPSRPRLGTFTSVVEFLRRWAAARGLRWVAAPSLPLKRPGRDTAAAAAAAAASSLGGHTHQDCDASSLGGHTAASSTGLRKHVRDRPQEVAQVPGPAAAEQGPNRRRLPEALQRQSFGEEWTRSYI